MRKNIYFKLEIGYGDTLGVLYIFDDYFGNRQIHDR